MPEQDCFKLSSHDKSWIPYEDFVNMPNMQ